MHSPHESLAGLFTHPDIPSTGEVANASWMRHLHLMGQTSVTKDITQLLTIEHADAVCVPDSRNWPRLVAYVTIGSQKAKLAIPALDYPLTFNEKKFAASVFREEPTRLLLAYRYGEQGRYYFQFNKKAVKLNELTHVETDWFHNEHENFMFGRDRYKPFDIDTNDRLRAKGVIRGSNEPFSLYIRTITPSGK